MGSCRGHRPGAGDTAGEEGEGGTEGDIEVDIEVHTEVGDIEVKVGDTRRSSAPRRQDLAIIRGVDI